MSQILLGASILEETHHLVRGKILLEGSERGLAVNFLQKAHIGFQGRNWSNLS